MERLLLDFNSRDHRGWIGIGPVAAARLAALRERRVQAGDRVEVLDSEGNRSVGTLREDPTLPQGHSWLVELDWSTWRVAEAAEERDRREAAGARP